MGKKKSSKKILVGGQSLSKRDLFQSIQSEGNTIYNNEATAKKTIYSSTMNDILLFIEDFFQTIQQTKSQKQEDISKTLETYGQNYSSYFILINATIQSIVEQANELLDYTRNINTEFQNEPIHIHLLDSKLQLLQNAKLETNSINKTFQDTISTIDSIITTVKNDYPIQQKLLQQNISDIETITNNLQESISTVNRPFPPGFIPKSNSVFTQGCPLGTVLENGKCNYYSDLSNTNLIESIPIEKDLITSSDTVIWFNKINQNNLGTPTIFKKKILQYLLKLLPDDATLYNVSYIVCDDNGIPKKDINGFYTFVQSIQYGWNQDTATIIGNNSELLNGYNYYYMDYDGIPQPVKVLENTNFILRNVETINKYICSVDPLSTILTGIKFVETDLSGNIKNNIFFYPEYYEYTKNNNTYTKKAYNNIDVFTYTILDTIVILNNVNKKVVDISTFDKNSYNLLSNFYLNTYTEFSIPEYYPPFILPSFFNNDGDYFLFKNTGTVPIILNISKTEDEKRVIIYPSQIITFVSSSSSSILSYGYLNIDSSISIITRSKSVALLSGSNNNVYVFVETKPLYDNNTYIMQQIVPLVDTEGNIISVPNFNQTTSIYYEFDDIFFTNPIKVDIIQPTTKVVNNKTYTSMNYPNATLSYINIPYVSSYVCATNLGNIFVFCNSSGIPNLDCLGYLIPLPSPIYYTNNSYVYYSLDNQIPITIKDIYINSTAGGIDDSYDYTSQLQTKFSSICNLKSIYTNQQSLPILYDTKTFIIVDSNVKVTSTNMNVPLPIGFQMLSIDINKKEFEMRKSLHLQINKVYTQNIDILLNHFKDLSGSMNNLSELKNNMTNSLQQLVISDNISSLEQNESIIKNIYTEVLDTYSKLNIYEKEQIEQKKIQDSINQYKSLRKNELLSIQTDLTLISDKLNTLKPNSTSDIIVKNDYNILQSTLEKTKNSFILVNTNIDNSNDLLYIIQQEKLTNLLLRSVQALQKNLDSYESSITNRNNIKNANILQEKQNNLQTLTTTITNNQSNIDTYNAQLAALPTNSNINILKQNITTSINNIKTLIDKVTTNITLNIAYTNDTIDNQIVIYQEYIVTINQEQQNIQQYFSQIQTILSEENSQELLNAKTSLQQSIQKFQSNNKTALTLLESLNLSLDQKASYESNLQNMNIEVQSIQGEFNNLVDINSTNNNISRVEELLSLNDTIMNKLQTLELSSTIGGKRKIATRKIKKSKKSKQTIKSLIRK